MSSPKDDDNGSIIPASQRPDGTWRKARRVKEGYVPQEEVPLYKSKGKKFLNKQMEPADPVCVNGYTAHRTIPGLFIQEQPAATKKEKKKKQQQQQQQQQQQLLLPSLPIEITEKVTKDMHKLAIKSEANYESDLEPAKKLKNLKKRLREVEALELKIKSGQVEKPEPEQLTKVGRKTELIMQIHQLEKLIQ